MKASRAVKRLRRKVAFEPSSRMIDHSLQRTKLGKEMTRARNDFQLLGAAQTSQSFFVQLDHDDIVTSNNQKCWRPHLVEGIAGEIGAPSARDNRADPI